MLLLVVVFVSRWGGVHSGVGGVGGAKTRVHDNVHDDMNMSLIMHDHKPVHSYDQHIIPHDQ